MKIFHPNPQILETVDLKISRELRHGFILFAPELGYPNGIRVMASVIPLPDGNHSIKCHLFEITGEDEHGVVWNEMKDLGFLTNEAIPLLKTHKHEVCLARLELHSVSKI
jgi:hypothetical protein